MCCVFTKKYAMIELPQSGRQIMREEKKNAHETNSLTFITSRKSKQSQSQTDNALLTATPAAQYYSCSILPSKKSTHEFQDRGNKNVYNPHPVSIAGNLCVYHRSFFFFASSTLFWSSLKLNNKWTTKNKNICRHQLLINVVFWKVKQFVWQIREHCKVLYKLDVYFRPFLLSAKFLQHIQTWLHEIAEKMDTKWSLHEVMNKKIAQAK